MLHYGRLSKADRATAAEPVVSALRDGIADAIDAINKAREIASDEHHGLTNEIEEMRADGATPQEIYWFKADYNYSSDKAEFFQNNRDHFLELAREELAVVS